MAGAWCMSCLTGPAGVDPPEPKGTTIVTNLETGIGGVDSHKDTTHVAVITAVGQPVADQEFPTTEGGHRRAIAWLVGYGSLGCARCLLCGAQLSRVAFGRPAA